MGPTIMRRFILTILSVAWLSACGKDPWIPVGGMQKPLPNICAVEPAAEALLTPGLRFSERAQVARSYLQRCQDKLGEGATNPYNQLFVLKQAVYEFESASQVIPVEFITPDLLTLRAQLLLQPTREARPLVMIKCGLHCDIGDPSLRVMLMMLYDEGPFHVLLIPSLSSRSFQRDNHILALGGFDEGRQLIHLAQHLISPAFAYHSRISRLHLIGVSLGGQAAAYAALYAGYTPDTFNTGRQLFSTTIAACPVIDLETSMKSLFRKTNVAGRLIFNDFWSQIVDLGEVIPLLSNMVNMFRFQKKDINDVTELIGEGALEYYQRVTQKPEWAMAPLQNSPVFVSNDLWKMNRFQNFAPLLKSPLLVWAAQNDPVVRTQNNTSLLRRPEIKSNTSEFLQVLETKDGGHCTFTEAYGWREFGAIARALMMSESPELKEKRIESESDLTLADRGPSFSSGRKKLWRTGNHFDYQFDTQTLWFYQNIRYRCYTTISSAEVKREGLRTCSRLLRQAVRLTDNTFAGRPLPISDVAAQVFTRWLNANTEVLNSSHTPLGFYDEPAAVRWHSFRD